MLSRSQKTKLNFSLKITQVLASVLFAARRNITRVHSVNNFALLHSVAIKEEQNTVIPNLSLQ